ncbi:MAG: hypothetical protein ACOZF0_08285 [Thermodesulfobacteriota bacterium]
MRRFICFAGFFTLLYFSTAAAEKSDSTRARMGIQIKRGQHAVLAENTRSLQPGDQLRIYVIPESEAFVYVVHSDQAKASLLNQDRAGMKESNLILPSPGGFFEVDGQSTHEAITIVCSHRELKELAGLFHQGTASHSEWKGLEQKLLGQNRIELNQNIEKPLTIAGNVRGISPALPDPFIGRLRAYSGHKVLVKTYAFAVQK